MQNIISIILGVILGGMIVVLCLFSCVASSKADEYWESVKLDMEKEK